MASKKTGAKRRTSKAEPETFDLNSLPGDEHGPKEGTDGANNDNTVKELPAGDAMAKILTLVQAEAEKRQKAEAAAEKKRREEEEVRPPSDKEYDTLAEVKKSLGGVSLSWSWMGVERMVQAKVNEKAASAIGANAKAVKTKRVIIDVSMPEWADLQKIRSGLNAEYNFMTFSYVIDGQRLFRLDTKEKLWSLVAGYKEELQKRAEKFQARRDDIIKWGKDNLGDAFDQSLYPDDFTKSFNVVLREHSIDPPSYLRHSDAEQYQQTLRQTLLDVRSSMLRFERECEARVAQSVGRVMNALTTGGPLHASNLENVQEVFKRIAMMKFEGTRAFKEAMTSAEKVVEGVDVDELRRSEGCRAETRQKLESLLARYKQLRTLPNAE